MSIIRTVTAQDLKDAMKECGRDYYSIESCERIIEYYEESDNIELDSIAIACDWCEEYIDDVIANYGHLDKFTDIDTTDIDEVLEALNYYSYAVKTHTDGGATAILYAEF